MAESARDRRHPGFTLVELLVVMAIIGIIIALILVAASDGVRRAEIRQTQALITKLETALTDRVDALLATSAQVNQTHRYLASITYQSTNPVTNTTINLPISTSELKRAQVIATLDMLKAELPDVFFVNPAAYINTYPLNFAAAPYPLSNPNGVYDFALPLGNHAFGLPYQPATGFPLAGTPGYSYTSTAGGGDTGVMGASFTSAGGVYKGLYEAAAQDLINANPSCTVNTKLGYNAVDDNGALQGLVDELSEVTVNGSPVQPFSYYVAARLQKHTHATARSETLYGVLVEGSGPLGSVFTRDDFTNREVSDTDGDGMPEFIDAWGQPLQFYRWPIFYGAGVQNSTDTQLGYLPYSSLSAPRQQNPLDANQTLVAPGWWAYNPFPAASPLVNVGLPALTDLNGNTLNYGGFPSDSTNAVSQQAGAVMTYFQILLDPSIPPKTTLWDRTGSTRRRAYYSKFLILSGGPDKQPGTYQLNKDYTQTDEGSFLNVGSSAAFSGLPGPPSQGIAFPTANLLTNVQYLNWCESQAGQIDYLKRFPVAQQVDPAPPPYAFLEQAPQNSGGTVTTGDITTMLLQNFGLDDITNQNLSAPGSSGAK
jgi:prepilin-type N-terminal cleavage/methylation domain-containing protein